MAPATRKAILTGQRKLMKQVEDWNARNFPGTPVVVNKDLGEKLETKTTSLAWVLGGHTPVVMVEGISGAYLLDRVKPVVTIDGQKFEVVKLVTHMKRV